MNRHCRIGKVILKGGAEFRVFPGSKTENSRRMSDFLCEDAEWIARNVSDDCAGYAVVAWKHDGTSFQEWGVSEHGRVTASGLPEFVAESFRRRTAKLDAGRVFDDKFRR